MNHTLEAVDVGGTVYSFRLIQLHAMRLIRTATGYLLSSPHLAGGERAVCLRLTPSETMRRTLHSFGDYKAQHMRKRPPGSTGETIVRRFDRSGMRLAEPVVHSNVGREIRPSLQGLERDADL